MASYVHRVKYTTEMLNTRQFYNSAAVHYDRLIVNNYLSGKSKNFRPDPVSSTLAFSSGVIPESVEMCPGASITKGVVSYPVRRGRGRRNQNNFSRQRNEEVPQDFPMDLCFYFNYRQCNNDNCPKAHVCRKCRGAHRADSCKEKTRRS